MDHSAYAGAQLTGRPAVVIVNGDVVVDRLTGTAGDNVLQPGSGRYLHREPVKGGPAVRVPAIRSVDA